jgi:hypothetical protein
MQQPTNASVGSKPKIPNMAKPNLEPHSEHDFFLNRTSNPSQKDLTSNIVLPSKKFGKPNFESFRTLQIFFFELRTFGLGSAQHYNQQPKNLKTRPEPDFCQTQNFTQKMLPLIFRHPFRRIQIIPRIMTRRDVIIFLWQF